MDCSLATLGLLAAHGKPSAFAAAPDPRGGAGGRTRARRRVLRRLSGIGAWHRRLASAPGIGAWHWRLALAPGTASVRAAAGWLVRGEFGIGMATRSFPN